jgi:GNAT superfamily N-acetyltransferase
VKIAWSVRLAHDVDVPGLEKLIPLSVRALQARYYSTAQMEGALGSVFGVDRQLIRDGTYFVVKHPPSPGSGATGKHKLIGCGGWSKRKTLFGSDHETSRDDAELNPICDAARLRAFFIHPEWARCGLGHAILDVCEKVIREAGFRSAELVATLPGEPFYAAFNYSVIERYNVPLANGLGLPVVRMIKNFVLN